MKYENQNNYSNVPYPSNEKPSATVKSGGCGCVSSVNVLRFFGYNVSVPDMAVAFLKNKIRVDGGTDMNAAAKYICDNFRLKYTTTSDETELQKAIQSGACAIANVGGNRTGHNGIFSTEGHYINVIGYDGKPPKPFIVYDCGYYALKYKTVYRKKYVSEFKDTFGNTCLYTTAEALNSDTSNRGPNYYIFIRRLDETAENMLNDGVTDKDSVVYWDEVLSGRKPANPAYLRTILNRYHELAGGK